MYIKINLKIHSAVRLQNLNILHLRNVSFKLNLVRTSWGCTSNSYNDNNIYLWWETHYVENFMIYLNSKHQIVKVKDHTLLQKVTLVKLLLIQWIIHSYWWNEERVLEDSPLTSNTKTSFRHCRHLRFSENLQMSRPARLTECGN